MQVEINGKNFEVKPHQTLIDNQKGQPYLDDTDIAIVRDEKKCIGCAACSEACVEFNGLGIPELTEVQGCHYYRPNGKLNFADSNCTRCGQCVLACPTGALMEKEYLQEVEQALVSGDKVVIAQIAPSIRVSVSESFGLEPAKNMEGEVVAALKKIGFKYVFDVNLGADFTTYEEAYDLIDRIKENDVPMFTSCCPARVKYIEDFHPELIGSLTSVRSPQECLAAIIKTYFAKKMNLDPEKIMVVSIMPCVAKKFETRRSGEARAVSAGLSPDGTNQWDVDYVLTTRELIKLIKKNNIDLANIEPQKFDSPLGESSGAGAIYGATGGVMESALRTVASVLGQTDLKIEYEECRGMDGLRKASVQIGDRTIRIAIAAGLKNAEKIIEEIKNGEKYDYVEVMACSGGCVGGGGQPKPLKKEVVDKRRQALYEIDKSKDLRLAHENPVLKEVYKEILGCPGGPEAKRLLHTTYDTKQARVCEI